ncbi:MAG TPA: acyltransferase [Steroidobacteraceae bacterium]|jgi:peptidoglycan/LPS O-acetylase OafA/YrhL
MKHLPYLDGWRGMAISGVLVAHFLGSQYWAIGPLGVDLFFVLSGLLMSSILFEQRTPLAVFYRRRISRIIPVFILFLIVVFGTYAALGHVVSFSEALASLTFVRTYVGERIWSSEFPIGHLWSLNVEEHSYLALSLVAAIPFMRTAKGWLLIAAAALSWLVTYWYWKHPAANAEYMITSQCAALPLLLSAGYRQVRHHFAAFTRPWMAPLALIAGALCYSWFAPPFLRPFVAPFLLAFAVNHMGESPVRRILEWKPLCLVGLWSFSIYLWQQPFFTLVEDHVLGRGIAFTCAMAVGIASFYLYEAPVRTWLNEHWRGSAKLSISRSQT